MGNSEFVDSLCITMQRKYAAIYTCNIVKLFAGNWMMWLHKTKMCWTGIDEGKYLFASVLQSTIRMEAVILGIQGICHSFCLTLHMQ